MATFSDVTPQNFQAFQNVVPELRGFSSVEGFAGAIQNPDFNPLTLSRLQQGLAQVSGAPSGFTAGQDPLADINFLARTGQVTPGTGGLFELESFSQFGLSPVTQAELDQALGQTRRISSEVGAEFGVLGRSFAENAFLSGLFGQVVRGTPLGELNLDLPRELQNINVGILGTEAGRQSIAERFRTFAEATGITPGTGIVDPFSIGFGESTPGSLFTSGGVVAAPVQDIGIRSQVKSPLAPTLVGTPGEAGTSEEFQQLLNVLGRVSAGRTGGVAPAGEFVSPGTAGGFFGGGGAGGFFGGGGFGGTAFDTGLPAVPGVFSALNFRELAQGREALVSQQIEDLGFFGPSGVAGVREAIPELGAAADVAGGAFGADIGADFTAALREAAAVRGVDPAQVGQFDAGLAAQEFLGQATDLATRTGFEDLLFAGFAPPPRLDLGTLGSLNIRQAELQAQIQSGIAQSQMSQMLFASVLPGLFGS